MWVCCVCGWVGVVVWGAWVGVGGVCCVLVCVCCVCVDGECEYVLLCG